MSKHFRIFKDKIKVQNEYIHVAIHLLPEIMKLLFPNNYLLIKSVF